MMFGPHHIFLCIYLTSTSCIAIGCIHFETFASCSELDEVKSLPPSIETLILSGGSMASIDAFAFRHLPQLRELNIQKCRVEIVKANAFSGIDNLDLLQISFSEILEIESAAFQGIRDMSSLLIETSTIGHVQELAFSDMCTITEMSIRSCNILVIQKHAFYNLSNIGEFSFHENDIQVMEAGGFSEWDNVNTVILHSNHFGKMECILDPSVVSSPSFNFSRNYLHCECSLSWMLASQHFKDVLLSNICYRSGNMSDIGMYSVTMADLDCPSNMTSSDFGCPHMAIPEVTMHNVTYEVATRNVTDEVATHNVTGRVPMMSRDTSSTTPNPPRTSSQALIGTTGKQSNMRSSPTETTDFSRTEFLVRTTSGDFISDQSRHTQGVHGSGNTIASSATGTIVLVCLACLTRLLLLNGGL